MDFLPGRLPVAGGPTRPPPQRKNRKCWAVPGRPAAPAPGVPPASAGTNGLVTTQRRRREQSGYPAAVAASAFPAVTNKKGETGQAAAKRHSFAGVLAGLAGDWLACPKRGCLKKTCVCL